MSRPQTRPASAPRASARRDDDQSLAVRAAWLHHAAGMTQSEVANRLGVTNVKAHRLIMWANQNGLVKVIIDGDIAGSLAAAAELAGTPKGTSSADA